MRVIKEILYKDSISTNSFDTDNFISSFKKTIEKYGKVYEKELDTESSGPETKMEFIIDVVKQLDTFTIADYSFDITATINNLTKEKTLVFKITVFVETQIKKQEGLLTNTLNDFYKDNFRDKTVNDFKKSYKNEIDEIKQHINKL